MQNLANKLTNGALLVGALLVVGINAPLAYNQYLKPHPKPEQIASPVDFEIGEAVAPAIAVVPGQPNIVIGVSARCPICRRDAKSGLYNRIAKAAGKAHVLVMLPRFRDAADTNEFIHSGELPANVVIAEAGKFPFSNTPTLLIVDADGKLVKQFVGVRGQEKEVMGYLAGL